MPTSASCGCLAARALSVCCALLSFLLNQHATFGMQLYAQHHEPLSYNTATVLRAHHRHKRHLAANSDTTHHVELDFRALGRDFRLRMRRDTEIFASDAQLLLPPPSGDRRNYKRHHIVSPAHSALDHLYHGYLADEPELSYVHGSLHDGVFQGRIETHAHTYTVESAAHFYNWTASDVDSDNGGVHSVIYDDRDLSDPHHQSHRPGPFGGCGVDDATMRWMRSVQQSAVPATDDVTADDVTADDVTADDVTADDVTADDVTTDHNDRLFKYTEEAQLDGVDFVDARPRGAGSLRIRRSPRVGGATSHTASGRGSCSVSVQTDPLLWRHVFERERDARRTREQLTALVATHIKAVNRIYKKERFDGLYKHRGIQFEIQRLKIDDDSSCEHVYAGERNKFCIRHMDVSNFLNLHSEDDHQAFCLSYVFTFRDFNGGTLGLAWVASAEGSSGGVCEVYKTYSTPVNGVPITKKRSLNTGIITLLNYGKQVPSRVSQLTLAHEIGHNMGSPHDFPAWCAPGGVDGNFIMYSSATSGDLPNNSRFSECSRRNISAVLDSITRALGKRDCFVKSNGAFCGNKIVEDGEQCDCGFDAAECQERCCYPSQVSAVDRRENQSALGCTRRMHAQCSPSEGPCCDRATCRFVGGGERRRCSEDGECVLSSRCDGTAPSCPSPPTRPNMTVCNKGTKVCVDGECKGSMCLRHGLHECFLTSDLIDDPARLCEVACLEPSHDAAGDICRSSSQLGMNNGSGIFMTAGSACDDFQGYCDVFQKCRRIDAEGPLANLKNLLFSQSTLMTIADWISVYWWAVLLLIIVLVIVMALFIRCFAVHTPSSNPKRAPARRFTDTIKHPMSTLRRQRRTPNERRQRSSNQRRQHRGDASSTTAGSVVATTAATVEQQRHRNHNRLEQQQMSELQPMTQPVPASSPTATTTASASVTAASTSGQVLGPPPPYSQPSGRQPTRHGYGQGRGHYSRKDGVSSSAAAGGGAKAKTNNNSNNNSNKINNNNKKRPRENRA